MEFPTVPTSSSGLPAAGLSLWPEPLATCSPGRPCPRLRHQGGPQQLRGLCQHRKQRQSHPREEDSQPERLHCPPGRAGGRAGAQSEGGSFLT